jgi:hypothetical protein
VDRTQLNRWKKAVVHLEAATNSMSSDELHVALHAIRAKHPRVELAMEEESKLFRSIFRACRKQGTALFLEHQNKRYLVTARHILHNQEEAKSVMQRWDAEHRIGSVYMLPDGRAVQNPERDKEWRDWKQASADKLVYEIIFRVPRLEEFTQRNVRPQFLHTLPLWMEVERDITFSSPDLDVAVVSLNHPKDPIRFGDELVERGYNPVKLGDIEDEPWAEGDEVFTVGFPSKISAVPKEQEPWNEAWSSEYVSMPAYAFGRVSMLNDRLPYFWCDMTIFPGNSGGPVIKGGNLVGIVTGQPFDLVENEMLDEAKRKDNQASWSYRLPFARAIKGKYVRKLLETQMQKLERWDRDHPVPVQTPTPQQ